MNAGPLPRLVTDTRLAHLRWDGGGPPIVLLHGVGGGRAAWAGADAGGSGTGAALAAAGHAVLAVDFPGYGLSATIEPYDLAGMAGALQATLAALACGPAVLVGHSMGGMVAQELAAYAPQTVAALVLASTSAAFGKPGGDWQQGFLQSRFAPLDAGVGMAGLAAQLVPAMVAPAASAQAVVAAQSMMAGVPEATYRRAVSALVAFDRRADLAKIAVPTLVITGEDDRTAAPDVARRMAERIPGATCQVVSSAGHLLTLEQPAAFHAALLNFLASARR